MVTMPGPAYEYFASLSDLVPRYGYPYDQHQWRFFTKNVADPYQYTLDQVRANFYVNNSGLTPPENFTLFDHVEEYLYQSGLSADIIGAIEYEGLIMAVTTTTTLGAANDVTAAFDALEYQSVSLQTSGTWTGTISFEVSVDGVNWVAKGLVLSSNSTLVTSLASANGVVSSDIGARYFRARMSSYTSGSATVVIEYSRQSQTNNLAAAAISGNVVINGLTPGVAATNLGKAEDAVHTSGDVGVMSFGVRNDNAAMAFTSATGDYSPVAVDNTGSQFAKTKPALTAANPVLGTPSTTSQQLVAANAARRIGIIQNNSNVAVFIRYGATAATTASYHQQLAVGATYELPSGLNTAIQMIAASAGTGAVVFTEITD